MVMSKARSPSSITVSNNIQEKIETIMKSFNEDKANCACSTCSFMRKEVKSHDTIGSQGKMIIPKVIGKSISSQNTAFKPSENSITINLPGAHRRDTDSNESSDFHRYEHPPLPEQSERYSKV